MHVLLTFSTFRTTLKTITGGAVKGFCHAIRNVSHARMPPAAGQHINKLGCIIYDGGEASKTDDIKTCGVI